VAEHFEQRSPIREKNSARSARAKKVRFDMALMCASTESLVLRQLAGHGEIKNEISVCICTGQLNQLTPTPSSAVSVK
jgi:hypothetical protein